MLQRTGLLAQNACLLAQKVRLLAHNVCLLAQKVRLLAHNVCLLAHNVCLLALKVILLALKVILLALKVNPLDYFAYLVAILRDSSAFMLYPYSALDIKKLLRSAILSRAEELFLVRQCSILQVLDARLSFAYYNPNKSYFIYIKSIKSLSNTLSK